MKGSLIWKMPTVEKRHLIRKRSRERTEQKIVENSKLFKEAIAEVMSNRAEIVRCYKVIRQLQSAIAIYQATLEKKIEHDQKEAGTDAVILENRPQEFAATPTEE